MAEHTKGQWEAREDSGENYVVRVYRDEQGRRYTDFICVCASTTQDNMANARLIAAAPDGFALAELIRESDRCGFASLTKGDWQAIVDAAVALISKATTGGRR